MSSRVSDSWQDKLAPTEKQIKIIKSTREDIFKNNYHVIELYEQFYKTSPEQSHMVKPKRQPNPFMILRAVLGLVAKDKGIKVEIGDGIEMSKLAGLIWKSASKSERHKFETLCSDFREFHKKLYPDYVYKPTPRNTKSGTVVDIKTADYYQSLPSATSIPSHTYHQTADKEYEIQTNDLDQVMVFEGFSYKPTVIPTIAANCPDPNDKQIPLFVNNDPITAYFMTDNQNILPELPQNKN